MNVKYPLDCEGKRFLSIRIVRRHDCDRYLRAMEGDPNYDEIYNSLFIWRDVWPEVPTLQGVDVELANAIRLIALGEALANRERFTRKHFAEDEELWDFYGRYCFKSVGLKNTPVPDVFFKELVGDIATKKLFEKFKEKTDARYWLDADDGESWLTRELDEEIRSEISTGIDESGGRDRMESIANFIVKTSSSLWKDTFDAVLSDWRDSRMVRSLWPFRGSALKCSPYYPDFEDAENLNRYLEAVKEVEKLFSNGDFAPSWSAPEK